MDYLRAGDQSLPYFVGIISVEVGLLVCVWSPCIFSLSQIWLHFSTNRGHKYLCLIGIFELEDLCYEIGENAKHFRCP